MNITIKKATIIGSLFLKYEFKQTDENGTNEIGTKSDAPMHKDLINAFRTLIPHFAFITEQEKDKNLVKNAIENPDSYLKDREQALNDAFFKFRVYEFAIYEKKGYEFLTLFGSRQLENLNEISFPTPNIDMDDTNYPFYAELKASIELCKIEVLAYMQGKQAPKAQMAMFEKEEDNDIKATMSFTKGNGEIVETPIDMKKIKKAGKKALEATSAFGE